MSTVLRPVGPRPARVYWVRRLVVLAGVVLVVLGLWTLTSTLRGGAAEPDGAAAAPGATDAGADDAAADDAGADDAAPDGGSDDAPADAPADDGRPSACAPADLTTTLAVPVRAYAEGETPTFTFAVTNGGAACTVDVGSGNLVVTVTSGEDRIWSSADCVEPPAERMLLLDQGAQHQETVEWSRVRSDEACTADLPSPRAGTYQAVATFHGAQTAPAVFELR